MGEGAELHPRQTALRMRLHIVQGALGECKDPLRPIEHDLTGRCQ